MSENAWHWEYTTHVTYVEDGSPWPFEAYVSVDHEWMWSYHNKKIIRIEPYRSVQGGGGGGQYSSYKSHSDRSSGLAVWWMEKVKVEDAPPPPPEPTNYEKLRDELLPDGALDMSSVSA